MGSVGRMEKPGIQGNLAPWWHGLRKDVFHGSVRAFLSPSARVSRARIASCLEGEPAMIAYVGPPAADLRGLRVLVVEDEALVALQLEDMLCDLGCAVVGPASRVHQALDLLDGQKVDAAVLDLNVAGELVYPVAEALSSRGLPFIFATGYGASGVNASYRNRPILQKPFLITQLRQAMLASLP
jgi:CheY-like chemotaxis protein